MLRAIRKRMTWANVVLTLVLVFAMTGGAYAAKKYLITSTKQISPKVLNQLKGKPGPKGETGMAGPQGVAGVNGKDGTNGLPGAPGKDGEEGEAGKAGVNGKSVIVGAASGAECKEGGATVEIESEAATKEAICTGSPWTAGGTLPSGKTETGAWNVAIAGANHKGLLSGGLTSISFPIPLESASAVGSTFVFTAEQTKNKEFGTSGCEGSVAAPSAPAGKMCVYTQGEVLEHAKGTLIAQAVGGLPKAYAKSGVVLTGINLEGTETEPATVSALGSWAVTAP